MARQESRFEEWRSWKDRLLDPICLTYRRRPPGFLSRHLCRQIGYPGSDKVRISRIGSGREFRLGQPWLP